MIDARLIAATIWVLLAAAKVHAAGPFLPLDGPFSGSQEAVVTPGTALPLAPGPKGENTRLMSTALATLLGPFGAHRLYLGTTPKVAVVYGVTFGGFGTLVLLDIGHLLFSRDLAPYRNNDHVFMWNARARQVTPR